MKSALVMTFAFLAASVSVSTPALADLTGKVIKETTEYLMKKFGREVAGEGAEQLAKKLSSAVARHGDDVIAAVRKVGPKAMNLADEAGGQAPRMMRFLTRHGDDGLRVLSKPQGLELFTRFGDDAAEVLIRHKGVATAVIEKMGEPAIKALSAVGPQAGRRMSMLAGDLAASPRGVDLMGVIARYGDPAMEFIWKHKAILAGGATLTAFLVNPEPYLNGTAKVASVVGDNVVDMATVVGENVAKPAIVAAGNVAQEAASFVRWTLTFIVIGIAVTVGLAFKQGVFEKPAARAVMHAAGRYFGEWLPSSLHKGKR